MDSKDINQALGPESSQNEMENLEIELLLEGIYRMSGYDFRDYMRSSLYRRIMNRKQLDKLSSVTQMLDRVLHDPGYLEKVLDDFSINVTEMYRDPSFFLKLRRKVIPVLREQDEIRIWHAGCSTGEEVYSMAILMEEEGLSGKTRIYATDINENVLAQAAKGILPLRKMQSYTKNYMQSGGQRAFSEYYKTDSHHAFLQERLKENIVFAQHNLVIDGSFNEFDLILCRNVMIYFNRDLQNRVLQLLHESLRPFGFLGLGSKESLSYAYIAERFEELFSSEKIYQKVR